MDKKVTNLDHIIVLITLLFECSGPDFTRLVHEVHAEELARSAGLVPGTDVRLGSNTGLGKTNLKIKIDLVIEVLSIFTYKADIN